MDFSAYCKRLGARKQKLWPYGVFDYFVVSIDVIDDHSQNRKQFTKSTCGDNLMS